MKVKKTYQVWALLRTEHGTQSWHAVTEKYAARRTAQRIADALWLEARVNEEDAEDED